MQKAGIINSLKKVIQRTQLHWIVPLISILGLLYWRTLLPTMGNWGDPAKLQFLGKVLGTQHMSGTPLYLMLNHLFVTAVPKGTLAFKANLLSACFSILAACFLFAILILLELRPVVAFVTALTFGLGYTIWSLSLVAEVHTLTTLFAAAVTYFLLKWNRTQLETYFLIACFLYALSFGNHLTTLGILPAVLYIIVATDRSILVNKRVVILVLVFFLIGLAQYGYIIWRTNDPSTPFLETSTQELFGFFTNLGGHATNRNSLSEIVTRRIPMFLDFFWREYYLLIFVGFFGVFQVKDRTIRIFILVGLCSTLLLAFTRFTPDYEAYFMSTFLYFVIFIGFVLNWIDRNLIRRPQLTFTLLIIPVLLVWANYERVDQSERTLHARIVEKVLATVESDALIVAPNYDYAMFYSYYLIGEGYESKNIYTLQLWNQSPDGVRRYLEGKRTLFIAPQRKYAPLGLRVFVMKESLDFMENLGLDIHETNTRYIYQVTLPGAQVKDD